MVYPDIWGTSEDTFFMDKMDIKSEFQKPCQKQYDIALSAMKFLCQYHDCDKVFEALRSDVKR